MNRKWLGAGVIAAGAVAGVWAALDWGNRYLDAFETIPHDQDAPGNFVRVGDGWHIHYTVQGEGAPLVLIHGFMDSHQSWRRNVDFWAKSHRVYAIDALGFGASERVRAPIYTLKLQARVLSEFFQTLNIPSAAVIGHSMGGALACQFAYDFPDLVHKLVLIAPATYLYGSVPSDSLRPVPRRLTRGVLGIYEKFQGDSPTALNSAYGDPQRITQDARQFRNRMMHIHGTHDALISMSKSKREANVPEGLNQIKIPALIIWGDCDHILPPAHALLHRRDLPNARVEFVEGAGHIPHEEEPEYVNHLVENFLK